MYAAYINAMILAVLRKPVRNGLGRVWLAGQDSIASWCGRVELAPAVTRALLPGAVLLVRYVPSDSSQALQGQHQAYRVWTPPLPSMSRPAALLDAHSEKLCLAMLNCFFSRACTETRTVTYITRLASHCGRRVRHVQYPTRPSKAVA